jgi:hypothetical protein
MIETVIERFRRPAIPLPSSRKPSRRSLVFVGRRFAAGSISKPSSCRLMGIQPRRPIDYARAKLRSWAERSVPVLDDHNLCGVPLVGRRYLKCGLGRSDDSRILRGPFEKRRDRPLERPAQIGEGIFDSQSSRCKHGSRYKEIEQHAVIAHPFFAGGEGSSSALQKGMQIS